MVKVKWDGLQNPRASATDLVHCEPLRRGGMCSIDYPCFLDLTLLDI